VDAGEPAGEQGGDERQPIAAPTNHSRLSRISSMPGVGAKQRGQRARNAMPIRPAEHRPQRIRCGLGDPTTAGRASGGGAHVDLPNVVLPNVVLRPYPARGNPTRRFPRGSRVSAAAGGEGHVTTRDEIGAE
jgi:hypothetical protein